VCSETDIVTQFGIVPSLSIFVFYRARFFLGGEADFLLIPSIFFPCARCRNVANSAGDTPHSELSVESRSKKNLYTKLHEA
jgi:hypothetical protein